jgi:hypothetical protein
MPLPLSRFPFLPLGLLPGAQISPAQEAELLSWWSKPVPFEEASGVWSEYLRAAEMPHGPTLERVLVADSEARKMPGSSSAGGGSVAGASGEVESGAAGGGLSAQLRELYESFSSRHGGTLPPPAATAAAGVGSGGGPSPDLELSWRQVQDLNSKLDVSSPLALQAAFRSASVQQLLAQHWQRTAQKYLPRDGDRQTDAAPATFEDLWGLMKRVHEATLSRSSSSSSSSSPPSSSSSASRYPLAGFSPAAAAIAGAEGSRGPESSPSSAPAVHNGSDAWMSYVDENEMRAAVLEEAKEDAIALVSPFGSACALLPRLLSTPLLDHTCRGMIERLACAPSSSLTRLSPSSPPLSAASSQV